MSTTQILIQVRYHRQAIEVKNVYNKLRSMHSCSSLLLRRLQRPVLGRRMDLRVHIHAVANEMASQTFPWRMETAKVLG